MNLWLRVFWQFWKILSPFSFCDSSYMEVRLFFFFTMSCMPFRLFCIFTPLGFCLFIYFNASSWAFSADFSSSSPISLTLCLLCSLSHLLKPWCQFSGKILCRFMIFERLLYTVLNSVPSSAHVWITGEWPSLFSSLAFSHSVGSRIWSFLLNAGHCARKVLEALAYVLFFQRGFMFILSFHFPVSGASPCSRVCLPCETCFPSFSLAVEGARQHNFPVGLISQQGAQPGI